MNKKTNSLKIIYRIYKQILGIVPFAGVLSLIFYVIEGVFPSFIALISIGLFDSVFNFIETGIF